MDEWMNRLDTGKPATDQGTIFLPFLFFINIIYKDILSVEKQ